MISKEIYVIRHGETDHNAKGIIQGKGVNLPLNEHGKLQADCFFRAYGDVEFDAVYTSTLLRAQQSVEQFVNRGVPHFVFSELDEISWGDLEGKITTHETDATFKEMLQQWREGNVSLKASATGESPLDLQTRQLRFLEHLKSTPYERVLIATHGRFIRAFMCTLTGLPLSCMDDFHHVNLCLYKGVMNSGGHFNLQLRCDTSHLSDIV